MFSLITISLPELTGRLFISRFLVVRAVTPCAQVLTNADVSTRGVPCGLRWLRVSSSLQISPLLSCAF